MTHTIPISRRPGSQSGIEEGEQVALDCWCAWGEAAGSIDNAAQKMVEHTMENCFSPSADSKQVEAYLFGAFRFLMDIAGKPSLRETKQ